MGNVAASGGYYLAVGSSTIFAQPATITGSNGVIGGKVLTQGLWDWLGVSFHSTQQGKNADILHYKQRFTKPQRAKIREHLEAIYTTFKERVTTGRGKLLVKDIDDIAGGRVYTGRQAKNLGLVDELGGLADAIDYAANEAGLDDYEIVEFPEPKTFIDLFMQGMSGQDDSEDNGYDVKASALTGFSLKAPGVTAMLDTLKRLDPVGLRTVMRSLMRIELLANEGVLMALPGSLRIR